MCKRCTTVSPHKFDIRLLAEKSVILVETPGHESEIFLPELQHGRVTLSNIIRSRQPSVRPSGVCLHSTLSSHPGQRLANRKLNTTMSDLAPKSSGRDRNVSKLRFELKLISNGNVVLAECNGYESEIFLPHIFSHCVTMKRVSAGQLAQYAECRKSKRNQSSSESANNAASTAAAYLVAHADNQTKLLVKPIHLIMNTSDSQNEQKYQEKQIVNNVNKGSKVKVPSVQSKKKHRKQILHKAAGDA
ncbi:uncharacterized protein LOC6556594 [Drosophila grimshawi]|uniref:GH14483 n=1 Tax=Drosophila grimshawi TaxID=7222 RepID=B4J023_DROGR|nr:uncharacterized protein LOC6556594 [Drosophila grimshawi]EDV97816.1 GH14483 [Drosophila grimshawi]